MNDPLDLGGAQQELFKKIADELAGVPIPVVHNIALNLLINAIRMTTPYRKDAEATIDNVVAVIRALYRMARSRGYVMHSPIDRLDPAELPKPSVGGAGRVLDELELAALVRGAADLPAASRAA